MSNFPNLFPRAQLKAQAKQIMQPNWGTALLITLIYGLCVMISSSAVAMLGGDAPIDYAADYSTSAGTMYYATNMNFDGIGLGSMLLAFFASILVEGILRYCYDAWFLRTIQAPGQKMPFATFIEGFNDAIRAALAFIWQNIWIGIWGLAALPGVLVMGLGVVSFNGSAILGALGILLMLCGAALSVIAALRYVFMYQVIADSRGKVGARQAMRYSIAIVGNHVADVFVLFLSFIPWYIMGVLTFGLGFLYVLPYMSSTYAASYQWLRDEAFREGRLDPAVLGYARKSEAAAAGNM